MSKVPPKGVSGLKLPSLETASIGDPKSSREREPLPDILENPRSPSSSIASDPSIGSIGSEPVIVSSRSSYKSYESPPAPQQPAPAPDTPALEETLLRERPRKTPSVVPARGTIAGRLARAKESPEGKALEASFATRGQGQSSTQPGALMPRASASIAARNLPKLEALSASHQKIEALNEADKALAASLASQAERTTRLRQEDQEGREAAGRARYGQKLVAIAENSADRLADYSARLAEQSAQQIPVNSYLSGEAMAREAASKPSAQLAEGSAAQTRARLNPIDHAKGAETGPEIEARREAASTAADKGRVMVGSGPGLGYQDVKPGHVLGGHRTERLEVADKMKATYPPVSASKSLSPSSGGHGAATPSKAKGTGIA